MKKIILICLTFLFFNLLSVSSALAVTKTSGDLEVTFDEPIFPDTLIWYPGFSLTKSLTVKNNGGDNQTVFIEALNEQQTGNLSEVLYFKALEGGVNRYGGSGDKTLYRFWNDGSVSLSDLGGGSNTTYDLTVLMDSLAGNSYQDKETEFDLRVGFLGTTSEVTVSGGGGDGSSTSAPTCNDPYAGGTPTLLSAVVTGDNQVTLNWSKALDPVTHYVVSYGLTPGNPLYGNPSVGGKDTTSYVVNSLSGGTTYYFRVRAGNGCNGGPYSNEISATPGGALLAGPAAGFAEGVLGVTSEEATESSVLGTESSPTPSSKPAGQGGLFGSFKNWLLPIALILLVFLGWRFVKKNNSS